MQKRADFSKIKTTCLDTRKCKVSIRDFACLAKKGSSFKGFYDSLPSILAANNFKAVVDAMGNWEFREFREFRGHNT